MLEKINNPSDLKKLEVKQLNELCQEIRQKLIETVTNNGGHLASNLGIVELSVALEYVFSENDKIIYDVGHQCYTHKILNNRRETFDTLRKWGGISGFPKPDEDTSDPFIVGHSSTSISLALGCCAARQLNNDNYAVVSVIGDGSLTNGLAYEALNNIGDNKLIVILNDNSMSISKNVGSLNKSLNKIRVGRKYIKFKHGVKSFLNFIPLIGKPLVRLGSFIKRWLKYVFVGELYFENFNMKYIGPINGHNIKDLISIISYANKNINKPVLLHVLTTKGKGADYAQADPSKYHGISSYDEVSQKYSMSSTFGDTMISLANQNKSIVVVSAAMTYGCGLTQFSTKFPDRFFDVGIAEGHAVTFAAGLAVNDIKPYVCVYSTFMQRAYDNVIHDICIAKLPVTLCLDRSGMSGEDGQTHQGTFDLSYLTSMPNMTILAPADINELSKMLEYSTTFNSPLAIRYPKSCEIQIDSNCKFDRWQQISNPNAKVQILCVGATMLHQAVLACTDKKINNKVGIVNARIVKPLDTAFIDSLDDTTTIITIEDNNIIGGFGSLLNSYMLNHNKTNKVINLGVKDDFIPHGPIKEQLKYCKLDSSSIYDLLLTLI